MSLRARSLSYAQTDDLLGVAHLVVSLAMYAFALVIGTTFYGNIPAMIFAVFVLGGASIRLFAVQHDNGHLSYFTSRKANMRTGVLLGAFTNNPFHAMRYNHNQHHAYIGNLDRMESHEVWTMTVAEFNAATPMQRFTYRAYRSMPAIFLLGPIYIFFLRYRIPKNMMRVGVSDALIQNALMFGFWLLVYLIGGLNAFVFLMIAQVATACVGTLIVYVGHNHESTYWAREDHVDFEEASLKGASVIALGPVFDFMTLNFSYHDLHHLNSKIPCYHLRDCHRELADELQPTKLGLAAAFGCIRWKLWDEDQQRMVRFSDLTQTKKLHPAE